MIGDLDNRLYDEINHFHDFMYVSASQALSRLFGFDMVDTLPPIDKLVVQLESYHTFYFVEGQEEQVTVSTREDENLTK